MTDSEKLAFTAGYSAAWSQRINGTEPINTYDRETDPHLFHKWQAGFDHYMESLL